MWLGSVGAVEATFSHGGFASRDALVTLVFVKVVRCETSQAVIITSFSTHNSHS